MLVLFFVYRYLIDRLGLERVGIWALVLATASATRVSELGLASSVTKFVASARADGNERAAAEAVQTAAISLALVLAILLLAVYPGLVLILPRLLPPTSLADGLAVLPYALISMWLGSVSGIWMSGLDGALRSDLRAGLGILSTLLFVALVVLAVPRLGLVGVAVSQVGQGALLTGLGWLAVRRVLGHMPLLPRRWSRSRFREMLGYGMNVQVMSVVMLLFEPTTKVLLARYDGLVSVANFELAQQLVTKIRALIVETNRVVVPVIAGARDDGAGARAVYSRNLRYLMLLLTPLFAGLACALPAVSEVWLGRYQGQFVAMAVGLTGAWYFNSMTAPASFAYLGQGRLRWLTVGHLVLGVSNLLLGVLLGPLFGWPGVITGFVVSLVAGSGLPLWMYHREHGLRMGSVLSRSDQMLFVVCLIAVAVAVAGYSAAVAAGAALWPRVGILVVSAAAILGATWRHPLTPEILQVIRRLDPLRRAV